MSKKLKYSQPPASRCNMFSQKQPRPKSTSFQTAASLLAAKPPSPPTSSRSASKVKDMSLICLDNGAQTGVASNTAAPSKATVTGRTVNIPVDSAEDADDPNELIFLTAGVEFSQRFMESHPDRNVMWEIYGRLINQLKDEAVKQNVLVLQNLTGGSLLQAYYYPPNINTTKFEISNVLRVVGGYKKLRKGCGWRFNVHRIDKEPGDIEDIAKYVAKKERSLAEMYPLS